MAAQAPASSSSSCQLAAGLPACKRLPLLTAPPCLPSPAGAPTLPSLQDEQQEAIRLARELERACLERFNAAREFGARPAALIFGPVVKRERFRDECILVSAFGNASGEGVQEFMSGIGADVRWACAGAGGAEGPG